MSFVPRQASAMSKPEVLGFGFIGVLAFFCTSFTLRAQALRATLPPCFTPSGGPSDNQSGVIRSVCSIASPATEQTPTLTPHVYLPGFVWTCSRDQRIFYKYIERTQRKEALDGRNQRTKTNRCRSVGT